MLVQEKLQSDRGSDGTRILLSVLLGNGTTASCNGEMKGVIEIFNLVVSFNYPEAALCGSAAGSQVAISRIRLFQINPSSPLVPAPGRGIVFGDNIKIIDLSWCFDRRVSI